MQIETRKDIDMQWVARAGSERTSWLTSSVFRLHVSQWVIYPFAIFILGLAYRATFLYQGFNATDEGWLQALGARVASGQLPYRDFSFPLPPVSIYKEAALISVFHDSYGVLASRWIFGLEVSLCSVIAFLIVRRYSSATVAFLCTVPTIFFSVILYYFSSYGYDGIFLALVSSLLLVYSEARRRFLILLSGTAAALAFLAKPNFLGLVLLVILIGVVKLVLRGDGAIGVWRTSWARRVWPTFVLGFAATCSATLIYFGASKGLQDFISESFLVTQRANPVQLSFVLWQDLPSRMIRGPIEIAAIALLLAAIRFPRIGDQIRLGLVTTVLVGPILISAVRGKPMVFIYTALGTLLALNLAAIAVTMLLNGPWFANHPGTILMRQRLFPPEIPLLAFGMQFLAQYSYAGIGYSYLGCFLSVPVALLFVYRLASEPSTFSVRRIRWLRISPAIPIVFGLWLALGSVVAIRQTVYRDGDRARLTAHFQTAKLAGITSLPSEVNRIDGMVAMVEQYTKPGDPIFVFPDLSALYFVTDRTNPTRVDWYLPPEIVPSQTQEAVRELEQRPPRIVFLQTYDEANFKRSGPPLDYSSEPKWQPIYQFVTEHYKQITTVDDIRVFIPSEAS